MLQQEKIVTDFNRAFRDFFHAAAEDPRLGPLHISLYTAILYLYKEDGGEAPLSVFARPLMKQAKISSQDTYHRYIRELNAYGYIHYIPSFNPMEGSLIYLLKLK